MKRKPTHPGKALKEFVLDPLGISIEQASRDLSFYEQELRKVVNEEAKLTAALAIKISQWTDTSPESWYLMQAKFDLWEQEERAGKSLREYVYPIPDIGDIGI